MNPPLKAWQFFALCPSCRRDGEPRAVRVNGPQKTITYWCSECERSWEVTGSEDEPPSQPEK
jgi:hypothetical protein